MRINKENSTPYEINEFHEIIKWKEEEPSVIKEVVDIEK